MLQPTPFIVEVVRQPAATPDISVSTVIGVLILPFIVIGVAAVGGVVVGGAVLLYKRWRDAYAPAQKAGNETL